MATYTIDTSPLVNKAIRQLSATSTFLRELQVLDSNKTNFLNQRIRTALNEIRKTLDAQHKYDARQLDETTKFSTKSRPDAEAVAKEHADFIVKEVKALLNKKDVEVYEYRVVNPIDVQLNKENLELKEQLKQKTSDLLAAQKEIARLNAELAKLTLAKEDLEKALAAEKLKFSGLLKAKLKVDERLKELERLLNKEKSDRAADVTALQGQLNQKEQELQTEKTNNSDRIPILEGDIRTLQGQLSALQTSSKVEKELSELQNLYTTLQSTEQKLVDNNTSLLEANRIALAANEKLKQDHEAELLLKTQEISALRQKLEDLQKALAAAQENAIKRRAERAGDAAVIYEQEKSKLQAEIDALREQLKQVEAEYRNKLSALQSQLAVQPTAPTSIPADLQKISNLQARIRELETALQAEVEKTAAALKAGETYQSKISELTEEIRILQEKLAAALQTATQQTLELSSSRAGTHSTAEELKRLKLEHETQIATLTARIKELEAQLATKPTSVPAERDTQDLDTLITNLSGLQSEPADITLIQQTSEALKLLSFQDPKAEEIKNYLIVLLDNYVRTIRDLTNKQKEIQADSVPRQSIPEISEISSSELDRIAALETQLKQFQESEQSAREKLSFALRENDKLKREIAALRTDNAELQYLLDTNFAALYDLFQQLAEALGIQEANYGDDKSAFVLAIMRGLKNSIETVKKAQVYVALEELSNASMDTIRQSMDTIEVLFDVAGQEFTSTMVEVISKIDEHIKLFDKQLKENKMHMSQPLKDQVNGIIDVLSDTKTKIQALMDAYQKTDPEKSIELYNKLIEEMYKRIFEIRGSNAIATLKSELRSKIANYQEKLESFMFERDKAMDTVNQLTNQIVIFLKDFGKKLGVVFPEIIAELEKGLKPLDKPDSPNVIIDIYQELNARWERLSTNLPIVLEQALKIISRNLDSAENIRKFLQQIAEEFNRLDPSITKWDELATDTENAQFVKQITDRLAQLPIKEQALVELQSKLDQYSALELQLQKTKSALEATQSSVKQLESMNANVVETNERLADSNVKLSQQLKLAQMGIPQQIRAGPGMPQKMFDEADLHEFEGVQGGRQPPISGGYDSPTYTPIIAAATGSLLWWGFGGLLVFLILIVIYLLGREIYRTQFKSETDRKNIK